MPGLVLASNDGQTAALRLQIPIRQLNRQFSGWEVMVKLQQAIEEFLNSLFGVRSPQTRKWYTKCLRPLAAIQDEDLECVTAQALRPLWTVLATQKNRWEMHPLRPAVEGTLSPYTLDGYVRAWRAFFTWCVKQKYIAKNPALLLDRPDIPDEPRKDLTLQDLKLMLETARDNPRDYAVVCFLADTGCRVGGLVGLRLKDLDLDTGRALVREKGKGGQHKARYVYMKKRTIAAMCAYLAQRPKTVKHDQVFCSVKSPITTTGVYQMLKRLAIAAGVDGRHNPHSFRHGFARGALRNGADLVTVSRLLGHSNIAVTARYYTCWDDDELKKQHDDTSWLPAEE